MRPIITLDGGHEVNEVFLDDVQVPVENLIGEENKGWTYAKFLLGNERTGIAGVGRSKERIQRIKQPRRGETSAGGAADRGRALPRASVAAVEIELKALEITQMRMLAAEAAASDEPDPKSRSSRSRAPRSSRPPTELLLEAAGPLRAPFCPSRRCRAAATSRRSARTRRRRSRPTYFNGRKISIYGGSNEIQRNIIAKAVLGL